MTAYTAHRVHGNVVHSHVHGPTRPVYGRVHGSLHGRVGRPLDSRPTGAYMYNAVTSCVRALYTAVYTARTQPYTPAV